MGNVVNKLGIIYGDTTLGVKYGDAHYIFSYEKGGLVSLKKRGKEWLYREPKPTFWRATTDNDRGNKFPFKSAMWLGADMFLALQSVAVRIDEEAIDLPIAPINNRYSNEEYANSVGVSYTFCTATVPSTIVEVDYLVEIDGSIRIQVHYHGQKGLPELPLLGMRFVMPTKAKGYIYKGLSGETYPDRMAGGQKGIYEVAGLPVTPYLVPQDCGVHMLTEWVEVTRQSTLNNSDQDESSFSLRFAANQSPFAFSCIPYTAEELESATHQEELPPERRTVLTILGKVRGVGGIDSWGSDVEDFCRINGEEDHKFTFKIQ